MDGFTGFKTAAVEAMPDTVPVMDPFHTVHLAGDALDRCRRRVQQALHGHRGRRGDPLCTARRALHTGAELLTDRQRARTEKLFDLDDHAEVEITWAVYQAMVAAYRQPDRGQGRQQMQRLIDSLAAGVPAALVELRTLGRTLKKSGRLMCSPTSTAPTPPTDLRRPSTDGSSTSVARLSASGT